MRIVKYIRNVVVSLVPVRIIAEVVSEVLKFENSCPYYILYANHKQ